MEVKRKPVYGVEIIFTLESFTSKKIFKKLRKYVIGILDGYCGGNIVGGDFSEDQVIEMSINAEGLKQRGIIMDKKIVKKIYGIKQCETNIGNPLILAVSNRVSGSKKNSYPDKVEKNISVIKERINTFIEKYNINCDYIIKIMKTTYPHLLHDANGVTEELKRFNRD